MTVRGGGVDRRFEQADSYNAFFIFLLFFYFFMSYRCRLVKYYFIKTGLMRNASTFLSFINCIGRRVLFRGGVLATRFGERKHSMLLCNLNNMLYSR